MLAAVLPDLFQLVLPEKCKVRYIPGIDEVGYLPTLFVLRCFLEENIG
jgi:hypothetical protein